MLGRARKRNAPREARARDGDVFQAIFEAAQDLVASNLGLDAELPRGDQPVQALGVSAQAKEVVRLLESLQRERGVLDAVAVDDLRRLLELLAADTVQAFVFADEDVIGMAFANPTDAGGHGGGVARLGGSDPIVVRAVEAAPRGLEARRDPVDPCLRRQALLLRGLGDLLPMLV